MSDFFDFQPPKFAKELVWAERAFNSDVVAKARMAQLTREEFAEALIHFYGGDDSQYGHLLDLFDEASDKYGVVG